MRADVVGPVCETGDFLARDRDIANVLPGDCLAVCTAGAYGFVAASNYNSRPRPPEVLVEGAAWRVVRARETYDDLVRGETTVAQPSDCGQGTARLESRVQSIATAVPTGAQQSPDCRFQRLHGRSRR